MRRVANWALVALVLFAVVSALSGCASDKPQPDRTAARGPSETATPKPTRHRHRNHVRPEKTPAATATPTPTSTPTPTPAAFVSCDANIRVRAATTTCPFAENVFYEYYEETLGYPDSVTVDAWSPAAAQSFDVDCVGGTAIICEAGDGAEIRFSAAAVGAYDDEQAAHFAATHDLGDGGPADGPDDDVVGQNIPNYEDGIGYRVQCADGMYSHSGGRPGACSWHGGVR